MASRNQNSSYRFTLKLSTLHKYYLINANGNKIIKRYHHEPLKFRNLLTSKLTSLGNIKKQSMIKYNFDFL